MPRPMTSREIVSIVKVGENVAANVPMITITAAVMMVRLRPHALTRGGPAPKIAPTERLAVTMPFWKPDRCHIFVMKTRTPEMTPRS